MSAPSPIEADPFSRLIVRMRSAVIAVARLLLFAVLSYFVVILFFMLVWQPLSQP
jgi:hypothetical protein